MPTKGKWEFFMWLLSSLSAVFAAMWVFGREFTGKAMDVMHEVGQTDTMWP